MRHCRSGLGILLLFVCTMVFTISTGNTARAQEEAPPEAQEGGTVEEPAGPEAEAQAPEEAPPVEAEVEAEAGVSLDVEGSADADAPAAAAPPEKKDDVEEIVVTGSRIRSALDKPAPILNISEEDMKRTGLTSVADMLQRLPVSGGALNTKFNSSGNFGFPPDGGGIGAGAAQADLRNLGPKRVLVLVDGVRWVNGSSASGVASATDLNTIPTSIIDRIEVLEDGASAIYGSDAIAGVINIITKKNMNGFDANAYIGGYHYGDGLTQEYNLSWGSTTEKASMSLHLSYVRANEVAAKDRDISEYPTPEIGGCTGSCSSGTPQGRFYFTNPNTGEVNNLTINDGVIGVPQYNPDNPNSGDFHEFTTDDRFNYAQYNLVQTPTQRMGAFTQLDYKLAEQVSMHVKALFNNRQSTNQAAPEPIFIGPQAGNGNRMDMISVHASNPYNPFGFTLDESTDYFIGRRPIEGGPRVFDQNVNTFYVSGGFHGGFQVSEKYFYWDLTALYSVNRADQIKHGGYNSAKLQHALGDPSLCRLEPGCVPLNMFGGQGDGSGTITPQMLDYISFVQKDVSQQELFDMTANITGKLFELPGGPVGLGIGGEFRYLSGFFRPDPVVVAGDSAGVPSNPTSGDYNVFEGYAEINLPILAYMPAFELLDLSGAIRVSNYSTFGTTSTFKVGLRWKPIEDLLLRGSFAQGFRAPSIGEAFGSESRYDQVLLDPCSDYSGAISGNAATDQIQQRCQDLNIPATYQQFNEQISVTTGGNPDLDPETSKGISASVVYSPSFLTKDLGVADQFDIELGYFRLDLDDAITAIDAQVQLDSCIIGEDDAMCEGISRTNTGVINGFANRLTNIGGILTDGLDINLTYLSKNTGAGRFRVMSISTVLFNFNEYIASSEGEEEIERAGTEQGDPERAYPKFKSTLVLGWALNDFGAAVTGRYIHSVTEECRGLQDFDGTCSDPNPDDDTLSENVLDPTVYVDLQLTWSPMFLNDHFNLTLGVNNLLNQDPPPCFSCQLNGFDATTYDVPGIFPYVRASVKM